MSRFVELTVDEDVLRRAQRGDRAAHAELFTTFGTSVHTLALRIVQRPDLADEVVQDTFVEVIRNIHRFRCEAPLGVWIRRIAVNKCLAHLRSPWTRLARPLEGRPEPRAAAAWYPAGGDLPGALSRLDPVTRAVVWLHDVEGYTHREIAAAMGRSESFSKSRLARGYAGLRATLGAGEPAGEPSCMPLLNNC